MIGLSLSMGLGIGGSESGGGPAPQTFLRPVANRTKQTFINTHSSDGINTHGKYLSRHRTFGFACAGGMKLVYANRCSEAAGFNDITVSARVRYPAGTGDWIAVTFASQSSITITSTGADVTTDEIDLTIPALTYFEIETYVQVASVGQKWSTMDQVSLEADNGEGQLLGTSSLAGQTPTPGDVTEFYGPVAILGQSTATRAFACITDSIGNGAGDTLTGNEIGFLQRTIASDYPVIYLGTSGEQASDWVSAHSKRLALLDACGATDVILAMGTNDIANTRSYSQVRDDLMLILSMAAARELGTAVCTILTRSSGGTPATGFTVGGVADQVNDFLETNLPLGTKFVDTRPGWQNASNVILSGLTDDNTHPNATGHAAIAAELMTAMFQQSAVPYVPTAPAFWDSHVDWDAETLVASIADGAAVPSWTDSSAGIAATEATARPTLKHNATPNGKASVVFSSAGNTKLTAAPTAKINDVFNPEGYSITVYKSYTGGASNFGTPWRKGLDRMGHASTGANMAVNIDYTTTDASISKVSAHDTWHIFGTRFNPSNTPILGQLDSFGASGGTTVAPSGTQVSNAALALCIGNHTDNSRAFDGEIARLCFFKGLSSDERSLALGYAMAMTGARYL
ncbi:SGNH/GDSL hydrolase family protein [Rhizorhapis suberifaciens]|uniref:Lysophospholipase L1-like esterase n=1 Tax=Rhizorhapis suberifaciens TaxID=13656 RepID=A0A840HXU5_9SPHN|nr:SGNH/GDSL hydrolase family protein [Rhizorhapis suberifaciens]MBB4642380.1 lysophospholipase L1-like esterase [Rhizorhapis suberifaciens]